MVQTLEVIYDGKVLKPCNPVYLKKNEHYKVQIEVEEDNQKNAWDILKKMDGTIEGPEDWSEEIDHYLYGTSKRSE
ncbi:MAG: antitoxin family protein [Spirochaetes bacterium]|nr:antitoxin family protein [Spirochaetota bacterium]